MTWCKDLLRSGGYILRWMSGRLSFLKTHTRAMMAPGLNHRSPSHYPYIPPCTPLLYISPAIVSSVFHFLLLLSTLSRQLTCLFFSFGPLVH